MPDVDPIVIPGRDESRAAFDSVKDSIKSTGSAIDQLKGKFAGLSGSSSGSPVGAVTELAGTFTKLRAVVGIPLLIIAGVTAAAVVAHKEVSALGAAAEEAGTKASKLSALQDKLKGVGGEAKDAAAALKNLRQAGDKGTGGEGDDASTLAELFKLNNQSLNDASGKVKAVGALYDDVAKMVVNAANGTDRLTIATLAFGSEAAPSMVKVIMAGATSFDALGKKGGETLDSITSKAREFDNVLNRMTSDGDGFVSSFVEGLKSKLLPAISLLYEGLAGVMALTGNKRAKEASFVLSAPADLEARRLMQSGSELDDFYNKTGALRDPKTGKTNQTLIKVPKKENAKEAPEVDAFTRAQEQTTKRIAVINAETATIGMNTEARDRAKVVAELEEAAKRSNSRAGKENIDVTEEQRLKINALADSMLAASLRSRQLKDAWDGVNESLKYAGNVALNALDVLTDKTKSWADFTKSALRDLMKEFQRAALTGEGSFAKLFNTNSASGGTGGIFGALAGAFGLNPGGANPVVPGATNVVGIAGSTPVPTFAGGGVIPAGGLALVSEHSAGGGKLMRAGDEPITVTPGNVSSGGGYTDNRQFHFSAPGASDAAIARLERMVAQVKASSKADALAAVSEHSARYA
jgi:hypothetical protein